MEEFVVYVLYSESGDRLYIGYSSNSMERFYWHNDKSKKGFTTRYRPWKMIHLEVFKKKKEAIHREKQLKGGQGRAWLRTEVLPQMVELGFISASGGRQFNSASRYKGSLVVQRAFSISMEEFVRCSISAKAMYSRFPGVYGNEEKCSASP